MGIAISGKIVFTSKWSPGIDNYQGSNCWLCFSMSISLSQAELATEYKPLHWLIGFAMNLSQKTDWLFDNFQFNNRVNMTAVWFPLVPLLCKVEYDPIWTNQSILSVPVLVFMCSESYNPAGCCNVVLAAANLSLDELSSSGMGVLGSALSLHWDPNVAWL